MLFSAHGSPSYVSSYLTSELEACGVCVVVTGDRKLRLIILIMERR